MRLPLAAALVMAVAGLSVAPATAAPKRPRLPDCATAGQTLAASATARVYALGGATFACRYGASRRIRIGSDGECQGDFKPSKPRLAGRYVGWVSTSCNLDASDDTVMVADLTTARVKWTSVAATGDSASSNRDVTTFIRDFEMSANGTVAFVGVFDAGGETLRVDSPLDLVQLRVLKRNSGDGSEIADEGQEIVPRSVALGSGGFYYRKGDQAIFLPRPTAGSTPRAADGAARQRTCAPRGSRTKAATATARVDELRNNEVYACRYRTRRSVFVGTTDDCLDDTEGSQWRLAGRFVAWVGTECNIRGDDQSITVTDLVSGERVHAGAGATGDRPQGSMGGTTVSAPVVNDKGSVAWVGAQAVPGLQVWRADAATGFNGELVDQGVEIDGSSLAITRDGFYYRKGASALFVPLR